MKIYNLKDLTKEKIEALCTREQGDDAFVRTRVVEIIEEVKMKGDEALFRFAKAFDRTSLDQLWIGKDTLQQLASSLEKEVKTAIDTAYQNIAFFHKSQLRKEKKIETMPGVNCWRENRAIDRVGLYIPGGTAVLPSTFLMLGIPAKIAGCREIVVCSPPSADQLVHPCLAYVAGLLGIDRIFLAGGAQAIAAMTFGTESIPAVDKIAGPGNRYVTEAKKYLQPHIAIDMPAGPSEVLVIAEENARPEYIAADLLAQAEHGTDSQSILVATSGELIDRTLKALEEQMHDLPRREIARQALDRSYAILCENLEQAMDFSNTYAPEHLILAVEDYTDLLPLIRNAGSVFLGPLSPESVGDYASGTNHTLPTSGFARAYSGVSTDTFVKKITFQHLSAKGLQQIASTVETLAKTEGLEAHRRAVSIRLSSE